jgi:PST family polysaccharide transporter
MEDAGGRTWKDEQLSGARLEHSIRRGTRAVLLAQVVSQLVSLIVLAALYRLIAPDQFGLLGMVIPLLLLAKIFASFGLNVATVQRHQLSDGQLSTVFWANLLVSMIAAAAMAASGPLVAWLYQAPQLVRLVAVLSGTLVVAALGAQHQALLERRLRMQRVVTARVLAQMAGGVAAVAAAWADWNVWALVVQQYVELAVLTAAVWWWEPWRPGTWRQRESAGELLRFGGYYALSNVMFHVAQNADKILLAWLLGASSAGQAALGLYSQAFNLMMKPVYLVTSPISGIMLPALARVAHHKHQLTRSAARFYRMIAILLLPSGVGLIVVAVDVMLVLGGEPWRQAGYLLMILAPVVLTQGWLNISGGLVVAAGGARPLFAGATASAVVLTALPALGMFLGQRWGASPWWTTVGAACGYTAATVLILPLPYLRYCLHLAGIRPGHLFPILWSVGGRALGMGLVVALLHAALYTWHVAVLPRLLATVGLGVAVYIYLARRELQWLVSQLGAGSDPQPAEKG